MNDIKFLQKISELIGRKKSNHGPATAFSKKVSQNTHYGNVFPGGENGKRKKGLRQRWQNRTKRTQSQGMAGFAAPQKEKRLGRPLQLVLAFSLILLLGSLMVNGTIFSVVGDVDYFRIHDIEFSGCRMTSPNGLKKYGEISYQLNMLTLNPNTLEKRLQEHPWVEEAQMRRIWPDGLHVSIKEYQPQALIVTGHERALHYMNEGGVVFAPVASGQELDFPVITGLDAFTTESEKQGMIHSATIFLRLARRNNPNLPAQSVSEIHFTKDGEMVLYLVKYPFPIYFGKGGIKRKYYQLRKVLEVLYRKENGKAVIENVAYIRMNYQKDKVLVVQNYAG